VEKTGREFKKGKSRETGFIEHKKIKKTNPDFTK
jgi:hypothetical protein